MRTTALKMDYWKLAAAMLALLGILLAVLLAAPPVMAEKAPPSSRSWALSRNRRPSMKICWPYCLGSLYPWSRAGCGECACDNKAKVTAQVFRSYLPLQQHAEIILKFKGGTATLAGDDRDESIAGGTGSIRLSFPSGETTGTTTVHFNVRSDDLAEGDETVIVTTHGLRLLGSNTRYSVRVEPTTGTIADNDPHILLGLDRDTIAENDSATNVTVTATLRTPDTGDTDIVVSNFTYGGWAIENADYTAPITDLTIPAGRRTGTTTLTITPTPDTDPEGEERIALFGGAKGDHRDYVIRSATITLTNDDTSDATTTCDTYDIGLSASPVSLNEGSEKSVTLTATRATGADNSEAVTVAYSLEGNAIAGTDYTVTDPLPTLTIPANQNIGTATLNFSVTDDTAVEYTEFN